MVKLSSFTAVLQKGKIVVRWVTESEKNTAGFDIERSLQPNAGFVKRSQAMIPAKGDELTGAKYEFTDPKFDRVKYYYQLKEYELGGKVNYYGPIDISLKFTLTAPVSGSQLAQGNRLTFSWEKGAYTPIEIEFSPDSRFTKKMAYPLAAVPQTWQPDTKQWARIQELGKNGKTVYWRVISLDGAGKPAPSQIGSFTLENKKSKK